MNPFKAMTLGPKSSRAMKRAKELAPDNPRVLLIDGTGDYFTPGMFGGDKEAALEKFERAARLAEIEQVDDPLMPSWGHAEAYAWIGYAHMEAGRTEKGTARLRESLSDQSRLWLGEGRPAAQFGRSRVMGKFLSHVSS